MEMIKLNIGGMTFFSNTSTLAAYPNTKLGRLCSSKENYDVVNSQYVFDRDPVIFSCIINMYRTTELHLPSNICGNAIRKELEFWEVPERHVSDCCWRIMYQIEQDERIDKDLKNTIDGQDTKDMSDSGCGRFRQWLWLLLDQPNSSLIAKIWNYIFMSLVAVSAIIFCLETIPALRVRTSALSLNNRSIDNVKIDVLVNTESIPFVHYLDIICLCMFTLELILHFSSCPYKGKFLRRFLTWVDIISITGGWSIFILELFLTADSFSQDFRWDILYIVFRSLYIFRLFRFLRLSERFTGLKVIFLAINQSKTELLLLIVCFTILATIFGSIQYNCEFDNNRFSNIPISIWWAVVTMTTVGYGDFVPTGVCGYFVGSICSLFGLLVIPMPIAIIAANFNQYYNRNKQRNRQRKKVLKKFMDTSKVVPENGLI